MQSFNAGHGGFGFTGARFNKLGASDYTLVTIGVDETGTVSGFELELTKMLQTAVDACKESPRSENILVRVLYFSSKYRGGVNEIHGFMPLADIDTASYPTLDPAGGTPLCDATYSSLSATNLYAEELRKKDYGVNGIFFIITDGDENCSVATMRMIKDEQQKALKGEHLESLISILVGVNAAQYQYALDKFKDDAGMTGYRDAKDATPRNLAKLAAFVSASISSQSQALGPAARASRSLRPSEP